MSVQVRCRVRAVSQGGGGRRTLLAESTGNGSQVRESDDCWDGVQEDLLG